MAFSRTLVWTAATLALVAGLLAWQATRPGPVRRQLVAWLGPPRVALAEGHVDTGLSGTVAFDHGALDTLLRDLVDEEGYVDYRGLSGRRADLDRYLKQVAGAPFEGLGRDGKLALLINAYNAFTLALILDHIPVDSIRDIPEAARWEAQRWNVGGNVWSLNQIEHEQIRPMFREPRIHFALVCAAISCPPLRNEAFVAERLEAQLEDQALRTHRGDRWYRYDPGAPEVELTPLYEWYRGDFEQTDGSVLRFAAKYDPALAAALEAGEPPRESFLDYDWGLNTQP